MLRHTSSIFFFFFAKPQSSTRQFPPCAALRPRHRHRHRRPISTTTTTYRSPPPTPLSPSPLPPPPSIDPMALQPTIPPSPPISNKAKKKARREAPESVLRHKLNLCSKDGDLLEALRLYDEARSLRVPLFLHHYNVLLYLCSSSHTSQHSSTLAVDRGFEIFRQMGVDGVVPDEATFTSVARLAAAEDDPALAFDLVKQMADHKHIVPRLRSYGPALFGFCKRGDGDGAYAVDAHMTAAGVLPEEPELAALIKLSSEVGRAEKVYEFLQRTRATVRQVSEATAEVVEDWFASPAAAEAGVEEWDGEEVKKMVVRGGGGWHGVGWLGIGEWNVVKTEMSGEGECRACGERLVSIDIDPTETENFATSLATLACSKEARADFSSFQGADIMCMVFQEWLSHHGPFEAVIDGANVGLYNQLNFSFRQLKSIVDGIRERSTSKKLPLVVLHSSRVKGGSADDPNNKKLLEFWRNAGALYATPYGSNDDWYWLYAAVSCKCLLVTNDEMRDHLFQLLGTSFFPRWKEKHQVRLTVSGRNPTFHWPPPYSIVIQESEGGSWHIPAVGDDVEVARKWICATRKLSTHCTGSESK